MRSWLAVASDFGEDADVSAQPERRCDTFGISSGRLITRHWARKMGACFRYLGAAGTNQSLASCQATDFSLSHPGSLAVAATGSCARHIFLVLHDTADGSRTGSWARTAYDRVGRRRKGSRDFRPMESEAILHWQKGVAKAQKAIEDVSDDVSRNWSSWSRLAEFQFGFSDPSDVGKASGNSEDSDEGNVTQLISNIFDLLRSPAAIAGAHPGDAAFMGPPPGSSLDDGDAARRITPTSPGSDIAATPRQLRRMQSHRRLKSDNVLNHMHPSSIPIPSQNMRSAMHEHMSDDNTSETRNRRVNAKSVPSKTKNSSLSRLSNSKLAQLDQQRTTNGSAMSDRFATPTKQRVRAMTTLSSGENHTKITAQGSSSRPQKYASPTTSISSRRDHVPAPIDTNVTTDYAKWRALKKGHDKTIIVHSALPSEGESASGDAATKEIAGVAKPAHEEPLRRQQQAQHVTFGQLYVVAQQPSELPKTPPASAIDPSGARDESADESVSPRRQPVNFSQPQPYVTQRSLSTKKKKKKKKKKKEEEEEEEEEMAVVEEQEKPAHPPAVNPHHHRNKADNNDYEGAYESSSVYSVSSGETPDVAARRAQFPSHVSPLKVHRALQQRQLATVTQFDPEQEEHFRHQHKSHHASVLHDYAVWQKSPVVVAAYEQAMRSPDNKNSDKHKRKMALTTHKKLADAILLKSPVAATASASAAAAAAAAGPVSGRLPGHTANGNHQNKHRTLAPPPQLGATWPDQPIFSPLTPYFQIEDQPQVRKSSKTMFGDNGWLEKTWGGEAADREKHETGQQLKDAECKKAKKEQSTAATGLAMGKGLLDNIVKKAKDYMVESRQQRRHQSREWEKTNSNNSTNGNKASHKYKPSSAPERDLAISLTPREQSLLFCEFEFCLATALDVYLTAQFHAGRLDASQLSKTAAAWRALGRPPVPGFRYDLETQLDLVRASASRFRFYGPLAASGPPHVLGVLDMMRTDARAMRCRTYAQPDTVVAKQLLDAQHLFGLLGCPEGLQVQLMEIMSFFKAALERGRVMGQGAGEVRGNATSTATTTSIAAAAQESPRKSPAIRRSRSQEGRKWGETMPLRHSKSIHVGQTVQQWATDGPRAREKASTEFAFRAAQTLDPAGYDMQSD